MAGGILPTGEAPTLAAAAPPCQRPAPPAGVGPPPFRGRFERMIRRRPGARRGRSAMQGAVFAGDRQVELRDFADPPPGPGEVVLEIKASGMCGRDLKCYRAAPGEAAEADRKGDGWGKQVAVRVG